MILVYPESKEFASEVAEDCCFCGKETRFWAHVGDPSISIPDMPCCQECSDIHTREELRQKAIEQTRR